MNILLVSAELAPFAKVGGLADISGALPIGWKRIGHNPIIVIPKYKEIEEQFHILKSDITITFTLFGKERVFPIWTSTLPHEEIPVLPMIIILHFCFLFYNSHIPNIHYLNLAKAYSRFIMLSIRVGMIYRG